MNKYSTRVYIIHPKILKISLKHPKNTQKKVIPKSCTQKQSFPQFIVGNSVCSADTVFLDLAFLEGNSNNLENLGNSS